MIRTAVIGGTGAGDILPPPQATAQAVTTPFGSPSGPVFRWPVHGGECLFLGRHGTAAEIAPHAVNYRANIWALRHLGADQVIGLNAVGGIHEDARPGRLVVPDQLLDYTWGRPQTFCGAPGFPLTHVDFTDCFSGELRARLIAAAQRLGLDAVPHGTYGVTQGPRLETAAEIRRMARDGCDVVGMTAMPEAGLARELDLPYAICAVVVNRAAGLGSGAQDIHAELRRHLTDGMRAAGRVIQAVLAAD